MTEQIRIKSFIDKCNWEGINYLSEKDDCKAFWKNNLTIALVLYAKNEKIYPVYDSKHNSNRGKKQQVNLLMFPNGEGWHYLLVKKHTCIIKRNNVKTPQ